MSAAPAVNAGALDRYSALFEARFASDPLLEARLAALAEFLKQGFPTQRNEEWKYTSLRRLESRTFVPSARAPVALDAARQPWVAGVGLRIVLVNGHWAPSLSSMAAQPPGTTIVTLAEWIKHEPAAALDYLLRASERAVSSLEQLNTAFFEDGLVVQLAPNVHVDEAVHIVHVWTNTAQPSMSHPRLIIRAGRHSRCTIVEQYVFQGEVESFTNSVATIELEAGAQVRHYRLQQESLRSFHIGHVNVCVREHARYSGHDFSLGGALSRLKVAAYLQESGAHAELHGLIAPMGTQHIDTHTLIEHIAPHTTSGEDYRGIADGRGRGVFNGKVLVHAGAQKTDARQSSRNLLLSATAEIDAKPELEIYADDVKCSHGATTGQLDATALFYLRSRGIPEAQARVLLIHAFAQSVLTSVESRPVREYLETLLTERFGPAQVSS